MVEEHSVVGRSVIERRRGRGRRENAGISSESKVRILAVESLRFPGEGSSAQGKSGPKARPRGVADGRQVEIPVLPCDRTVGTRKVGACRGRRTRRKRRRDGRGKSRPRPKGVTRSEARVAKSASLPPRKAAMVHMAPVP